MNSSVRSVQNGFVTKEAWINIWNIIRDRLLNRMFVMFAPKPSDEIPIYWFVRDEFEIFDLLPSDSAFSIIYLLY